MDILCIHMHMRTSNVMNVHVNVTSTRMQHICYWTGTPISVQKSSSLAMHQLPTNTQVQTASVDAEGA